MTYHAGGTQRSHDIVSHVVGLALVSNSSYLSAMNSYLPRSRETRCTAAMQLYPLHRRFVSSSIRAARVRNFHGESRGGKLE